MTANTSGKSWLTFDFDGQEWRVGTEPTGYECEEKEGRYDY